MIIRTFVWSFGFLGFSMLAGCCSTRPQCCEKCGAPINNGNSSPEGFLPRQVRMFKGQRENEEHVYVGKQSAPITGSQAQSKDAKQDAEKPITINRDIVLPTPVREIQTLPVTVDDKGIERVPYQEPPAPAKSPLQTGARPIYNAEPAVPFKVPHLTKIGEEVKATPVAVKEALVPLSAAGTTATMAGQVHEFRKVYRLRYASVGDADPYGGSVILEGSDAITQIRDGQRVRVRGELIPPANRGEPARLRVVAVEVLE